jgi:hypothetical protein
MNANKVEDLINLLEDKQTEIRSDMQSVADMPEECAYICEKYASLVDHAVATLKGMNKVAGGRRRRNKRSTRRR